MSSSPFETRRTVPYAYLVAMGWFEYEANVRQNYPRELLDQHRSTNEVPKENMEESHEDQS